MKNIKYTVCALAAAGCLSLAACNDDFLQQTPLMSQTEENSLKSELDFEYYLNRFYDRYAKGNQNGWANTRIPPFDNIPGPAIPLGDGISDNVIHSGGDYNRMNGSYRTPSSGAADGWEWEGVRQLNYFLNRYEQAEVSDPNSLKKWTAEAYFFKAWDYYRKVMLFGDVPWLSKDLNTESEELYAPRDSRETVMGHVREMINYAAENANDPGKDPSGRINRDKANFLKARIALFEGTFRKYHTELGLQGSANEWLQECVDACEAIIATGRYGLFTTNSRGYGAYWELFTQKGLTGADHPEAIMARVYDGETTSRGHSFQRYMEQNHTNQIGRGMSRSALDEYLCADGQPVGAYTGGTSDTPGTVSGGSPLFKGYDGWWSELDNRDPRLLQTVAKPGSFQTISSTGSGVMSQTTYGIIYPVITYSGNSTVGGYTIAKHFMADKVEYDGGAAPGKGTQTSLIFRYAEVLLMLAEAKAELGTITNADLDRTVNALRTRAGFNFTTYPNAKLSLSNIPADPRLDAVYADKLNYSVSPIIREIRRERRVEMFMEGQRWEDLMRWNAGKLLTVPMRGMKMTEAKITLYSTTKSYATGTPVYVGIGEPGAGSCTVANMTRVGTEVFIDAQGFIIANPRDSYLGFNTGVRPWDETKNGYWPIPLDQLTLNPQLTQNPGWEGVN